MKKRFSLLLVVMLLCAAMTGCFTSINTNPTEPEEPTGDTEKTTSVKITDTFSAEDPEGVTYETRHVYAGDKNCVMVQNMALQGYNASAMYIILYENEGKAALRSRSVRTTQRRLKNTYTAQPYFHLSAEQY